MNKIYRFFESRSYIGLFLLRLFIGLRLLYGVLDNLVSWDQMLEFSNFLEANQFPFPVICAVISVWIQAIGAVLLLIGFKTRIAALLLTVNFLVALVFFHLRIQDSIEGMTPASAMLFGCLTLLFTGAGKFSLDFRFNEGNR